MPGQAPMTSVELRRAQREWPASDDRAIGQSGGRAPSSTRWHGRLKVLLVSHAFPPKNIIGAVRVGKFAKYLHEAGHDVRVIAAHDTGDLSLPVEIPADRVAYATGRPVGRTLDTLVKLVHRWWCNPAGGVAAQGPAEPPSRRLTSLTAALTRHYYALLCIPDFRAGWIGVATAAGYDIVRDWRPDIVVASAPPYSSLMVASRIARVCGAPWVAELRDLWSDNPYYEEPRWRFWVDRLLERWVLKSAAGLVTVTPGWAETLRRRYRQPIACVLNGYVEEDFPAERPGPMPGDVVSILYTGNIYEGYRDPSALFRAIGLLGAERDRVAVHFYGPPKQVVEPLATAHRVLDRVFVHDRVSYKASLALQTSADVLLLLQWNHQKDEGNIPAKFFEYLGARRPILMLGYEHGDLAEMIREREAGLVSNDPPAIADQLRRWIAQRPAQIPPLDRRAREGMTRAEQYRKLEQFMFEVLDAG